MRFEELVKNMIRSYFVIVTGITVSIYVFCLLINPDAVFSIHDIGRILLMALVSDLPHLIFLSHRELGKKQMMIRMIIHYIVLSAILLYFAFLWDWVSSGSVQQIAVFLFLVLAVYIFVSMMIRFRDKKLTDQINRKLKERYRS